MNYDDCTMVFHSTNIDTLQEVHVQKEKSPTHKVLESMQHCQISAESRMFLEMSSTIHIMCKADTRISCREQY